MICAVIGQSWIRFSAVTIWNFFVVFTMITNQIIPTIIVRLTIPFTMVERKKVRRRMVSIIHQVTKWTSRITRMHDIFRVRRDFTPPIGIMIRTLALCFLDSPDSLTGRIGDLSIVTFAI